MVDASASLTCARGASLSLIESTGPTGECHSVVCNGVHAIHQAISDLHHALWLQADVLERIAEHADDSLAKWELAVVILCQQLLSSLPALETSPASGGHGGYKVPGMLAQRILAVLLRTAQALQSHVAQLCERFDRQELLQQLTAGQHDHSASWCPRDSAASPTGGIIMQQAEFVTAVASLVASIAAATSDPQQSFSASMQAQAGAVYQQLCAAGFRPSAVLCIAQLLAAGIAAPVPAELLPDSAAVLFDRASLQQQQADTIAERANTAEGEPLRMAWLGRLVMSLQDASTLDAAPLLTLCRCALKACASCPAGC